MGLSAPLENYIENHYFQYKTVQSLDDYSFKNSIKSLIVPGWGQYKSGDYSKAFIFICIESVALGIYYNYNKKGTNRYNKATAFADQYWSFSKWITDYYDFEGPLDDGLDYSYIFKKEGSGLFEELWGGGHKIEFFYDNKYYSTGPSFENFYDEVLGCDGNGNCNQSVFEEIIVTKDHNYYENIGKYDHFFAGWDDNKNIYEVEKKISKELLAFSPYKREYRYDWDNAKAFNKIADYALYTIYSNHFLSLLDILIFSKINKDSKFSYKLGALYNPNNDFNFGGLKVSILW